MVKHYNTSIAEDAARILNSKQGQFLGDDVTGPVATIPIEPRVNIVRSTTNTSTGNATIYTTPSDKDFYLTGLSMSAAEDATSDNVATYVDCVIDGVAQRIMQAVKITTTARSVFCSREFSKPIKLDRASVIRVANSFTVGTARKGAEITGYTVETTK